MPERKEDKPRKRRKQKVVHIPAWVLDKLEVPKYEKLTTVESRWMFEVKETFLIVTRTENKAIRRETIGLDLLLHHPTLLTELIAWMNFALSTTANIEDIAKILAEVESYLSRNVCPNADIRFEDFVYFESQLISHRYPNEYNPDYMDIFFSKNTSEIIFSNILKIPTFMSLLRSEEYRQMSLEQKSQVLTKIVDLYYWFRYRLHTISTQLYKKQIQRGKKGKVEVLTFTFFGEQETSIFGHISSNLIAQDMRKYFSQLEEKIASILSLFHRDTDFSPQIKQKLIGQVCFDLRQGLNLLSELKYDTALANHLSGKRSGTSTPITFSYRHENGDIWVAPSEKDNESETVPLRTFPDKALRVCPTQQFLCLTQESIPVLQTFGRCPHREKTTSIVEQDICPHRSQE